MNCHTESIFTGHSVYWCLTVNAGKNRFFKCLKVDIISSKHTLAGMLWFLYLRDNPVVELMILVAPICTSSFKPLCWCALC